MKKINVIFFGSTSDSVLVLEKLASLQTKSYKLVIAAVVTQPPRPVGRKHDVLPTAVETWGKEHNVTVLSFPSTVAQPWLYANEQTVIDTLAPFKADLLVSASYGQKIPAKTLPDARFGGLNVHPSLLPRWRGADPVPWAILAGDHQTGVTIVILSKEFDEGRIVVQKKVPIVPTDETDPLRARLFALGADLLVDTLPEFLSGAVKGTSQDVTLASYARRLTRDDGFIPWEILQKAMAGEDVTVKKRPAVLTLDASHIAITIAKARRALTPWPGLWTMWEQKRLKILSCHAEPVTNKLMIDMVQLAGKNPVPYEQFLKAYLSKRA